MTSAIRIETVSKSYLGSRVLDEVTAGADAGKLTVISGPSGSGKTTLLNLISALDLPDSGCINVGDVSVGDLTGRQRDRYRAANGHVFQRSGLLSGLTVQENIQAGHALTGQKINEAWVRHLVDRLGIANLLDSKATQISGGQAQRVAIVRSLAHRPALLFADEPTASLDTASTQVIHELLRDVAQSEGTTVLMVSHDDVSLEYAHAAIALLDGQVAHD